VVADTDKPIILRSIPGGKGEVLAICDTEALALMPNLDLEMIEGYLKVEAASTKDQA
jgi:hypothetical protein